jgi:tRNA threonylcarbamoyladenosine biosynthesis protein TsaE
MQRILEIVTSTAEETRDAGGALASLLRPGDVVSLTGDLGAGKTTFVQGAARALGVTSAVVSPTFVLVREYHGALPVMHIDVYRLKTLQEVIDLGFDEFLDSGWVVFVEWGDVIDALFPESYLEVDLSASMDDVRRVRFTGRGSAWAERWEPLEQVLSGWRAA